MKDDATRSDASGQIEDTSPAAQQAIPTSQVASPPQKTMEPAPRLEDDQFRRIQARWSLGIGTTVVVVLVTMIWVISPLPAPMRTYIAFSACAGALVMGGLFVLIVLIPALAGKSDVRTELYSVRAAYLCVVAGLILLGIITVGAIFARVKLTLGGN